MIEAMKNWTEARPLFPPKYSTISHKVTAKKKHSNSSMKLQSDVTFPLGITSKTAPGTS